jgi:membrane-bound lytic murein transglycosylase A
MIRAFGAVLLLLASSLPTRPSHAEPVAEVGGARLQPVPFADLMEWGQDDHLAAFRTFRRSCEAPANPAPTTAPQGAGRADLGSLCAAALGSAVSPSADGARRFFESHFAPYEVIPPGGRGFLTGYFEPEYEGSLAATDTFATPLLARPGDLVTAAPGEALPGVDPALRAARRTEQGLSPYPDRAAIEDGALGANAKPIVFVRDPVEALVIHVQGSTRIRLNDGRVIRVAYDGRNGQPYTSVGRIIVERGHVPLPEMNLERLIGWLRANPAEGREIIRQNRSYIFFRIADELDPADGPVGGAGVPLTAGRSLAVDHSLWSYGLPFWLDGELPLPNGGSEPLRRLMIAQDTGTAIVGPARGDFFFGTGADAGTRAGLLRHPARFVVFLPKPRP